MKKSTSAFREYQIRYIQKVTKVSRDDLIKTIRIARVNLEEVTKYLQRVVSNRNPVNGNQQEY